MPGYGGYGSYGKIGRDGMNAAAIGDASPHGGFPSRSPSPTSPTSGRFRERAKDHKIDEGSVRISLIGTLAFFVAFQGPKIVQAFCEVS